MTILEEKMAKVCYFTGKKPQSGNNVSHANNKTKRRFMPNLQRVRHVENGKVIRVWASTEAIRSGLVKKPSTSN